MIRRLRLIRNPSLTVARLLDELLLVDAGRLVGRVLDAPGEPEHTLAQLHAEVAAMSRFLKEEAGLKRGDRVAIWKTNEPRCFDWFLAVIRAGGIAVPLNPLLPPAEVRGIVDRCGISTLVTDAEFFSSAVRSKETVPVGCWVQDRGEDAPEGFLHFTSAWLGAPTQPPADVAPADPVAILCSSGTEGSPRSAVLTSEALLAARTAALVSAPLAPVGCSALLTLPWSHIMAVSTALYGLMAGIGGLFLRRFEVHTAVEAIRRHRIKVVVGVPAMFIRLVNSAPDAEALASVRVWISASDHLPGYFRRRLLEYGALLRGPSRLRIRPVFVNAYGMVELGGIAMFGLDAPFVPGDGELCLPVPPLRVRVVDEQGRDTPPGETGHCLVSGPGVTGRYWGDARPQSELLAPGGWLRTGDLAERSRLGLVRLAGRAKDVIKCGGYSVLAREVEEVLASHPGVARVAVIGVPHPEKGEVPVAVLEPRLSFTTADEDLSDWCRARLAAYKVPRRFHRVAPGTLPVGVTEKVLKRVLRQQFAAEFGSRL
ncbi:MAG: class I adenylate-forming enzyme family protein [Bryobacteraceae bacterium]